MQANFNLQAASYESPFAARSRIKSSAPRQNLTEYAYQRQKSRPGTPTFGNNNVQPGLSAEQLRNSDDAKQANRTQLRNAMGASVDQQATAVRLNYEFMREKGSRGQQLIARA